MKHEASILKERTTDSAIITLYTDDIVRVLFLQNITIDVENQNENYRVFMEMTEGRKCGFIFEAQDGVTITKEARDNSIVREKDVPAYAFAVLVHNLAYKLIADFYYRFNKPVLPYKVFRKREEAIQWLLSQK